MIWHLNHAPSCLLEWNLCTVKPEKWRSVWLNQDETESKSLQIVDDSLLFLYYFVEAWAIMPTLFKKSSKMLIKILINYWWLLIYMVFLSKHTVYVFYFSSKFDNGVWNHLVYLYYHSKTLYQQKSNISYLFFNTFIYI